MKQLFSILFIYFFLTGSIVLSESIATIVDRPGKYVFMNDFVVEPTEYDDAIIDIQSSGVIIDLSNSVLSQSLTSTVTGLVGIRVRENLSDVSIQNGTISNIKGKGIELKDGCNLIAISDCDIFNCDQCGIGMDGLASGTGINNISIDTCKFVSCNGSTEHHAYGIKVQYVTGFLLDKTLVLQNDGGLTTTGYGMYVESSSLINITDSIFSGNAGLNCGIGASFVNTSSCYIRRSFFNGNYSRNNDSSAYAAGVEWVNCYSCRMEACEALNNVQPFAHVIGYKLYNGAKNMLINCIAENNSGGLSSTGIELQGQQNSQILNCIARLNVGSSAFGIRLKGANNQDCLIKKNELIGANGAVGSYGILDESEQSSNMIILNEASDCANNYQVTYPVGINFPMLSASLTDTTVGIPIGPRGAFDNLSIRS